MGLQLYRRHCKGCKAKRPDDSRTGKFEEGRRGWKKCSCQIFASGTLGGKFKRQCTDNWEWDKAEKVADGWEQAESWPVGSKRPAAVLEREALPELTAPQQGRKTVHEVLEAYLSNCKSREIRGSTLAKYKTLTNQLEAYCKLQGYTYIDRLQVTDMDAFYAAWKDGKKGKAKKLERLKGLVRFCLKRKWLTENIAEDLKAPPKASELNAKSPFEDGELKRIYAACDKIHPQLKPGPGYRTWDGQDAKDFIHLSIYTGLRISDICLFDVSQRLKGNDVYLRMHKTGNPLHTWIPDWLAARLRARAIIHGPLIFRCGVTGNAKQLCDIWRNKRLKQVFRLAGPFKEKPGPHRFRHTFARILLERGVEDTDVAELIGDTVEVVRRYYSKWIPSRQKRLTNILQEAFADRPESAPLRPVIWVVSPWLRSFPT
jgi:integrase